MTGGAEPVRHILCGVDGSEPACRAIEVAACLARNLDAKLTLISIAKAMDMTPELRDYPKSEGLGFEQVPLLPTDAQACLDGAAQNAESCGLANAGQIVRTGDRLEQLQATIGTEDVDLVVLGHHARSSAHRLVSKPLSQQIADTIPVKLLLVP